MPVSSVVSAPRHYAPDSACWASFVLAHGAGAGHQDAFMVQTAVALAAQGVAVTTFDFPYMAEGRRLPDRMPRLLSAFAEVACAVHQARPTLPLFVGGKSMGGRVATHMAADPPAALATLAGVVALGYPLRPPSARRPLDRTTHLPRLTAPLLIVQGTRDEFGGPDDIGAALTAAGVSRSTVIPVADADHSFRVRARSTPAQHESDACWQQAVVAWMRAQSVRPDLCISARQLP